MTNKSIKVPLTQEVYSMIKKMVIDLHFRPGEIIYSQQLADRLNVSRTPVREALVKLVQEGLMVQTDTRKFMVSEITIDSIIELYDLREAFEILSLNKVFAFINDKDIDKLQDNTSCLKNAFKNNDYDRFFELDMEFHYYFIEKYNNSILKAFINQLLGRQQRIRYVTKFIQNRMQSTIREHQQILDALTNKDLKASDNAIRYHLEQVRTSVINLLSDKDGYHILQFQLLNNNV